MSVTDYSAQVKAPAGRQPLRRSGSADIMGNSAVLVALALARIASQVGSALYRHDHHHGDDLPDTMTGQTLDR